LQTKLNELGKRSLSFGKAMVLLSAVVAGRSGATTGSVASFY
jgi:hypothetical protein